MTNNGSVVIDAGHGGSAPAGRSSAYGVRGPSGAYEKDVMLALAQRVAAHYGPGAALTRASDVNVPLAERTAVAQRLGAPVFISLHANSGPRGARGAETYVHDRGTARSMALADAIQRELGAYGHATAPIGREALAVLSPDRLPSQTAACLLEVDYLSDPYGERRLTDPGQLDRLGAAIARGIRRYMGAQPALAQGQQLETIAAIAEVAGAFFEAIRVLGQVFQADGLTVHSNETKVTHRTGPSRRNPWQDRNVPLVQFDCTAGTFSSARADFNVQWQANGNDIDHCRIWKAMDTGWNGGMTGSKLDVTFSGSDGNNYTPRGVACVLMHVSGRLDPAGGGDINFDFDVLVKADGTIENHGPVSVPQGQDASQFTFTALVGGGWRIAQNP
jgi:N-acetylmuramoyl-L-alanine amidase